MATATATDPTCTLVMFTVGGLDCAIALDQIEEVVAMPAVTPLPGAPDHLLGAIDFHGRTLAVIDLHRLLGLSPTPISVDQYLLVMRSGDTGLAARCDGVHGLVGAVVESIGGIEGGFIHGLAKGATGLLLVLDASALEHAVPLAARAAKRLIRTVGAHG